VPCLALGIAALEAYGSHCAQVAEVSVEGDHFRVERVVCAIVRYVFEQSAAP